jgi:hypothetical protein
MLTIVESTDDRFYLNREDSDYVPEYQAALQF